jgi:hypothetical protein
MFIRKILETRVDLHDPNDVYVKDIDTLLLSRLRSKFVHKCYKSCFIIKVLRILRRSFIRINSFMDGMGYVNVNFEVQALVYNTNEIITGATIINKDPNGRMQCKSAYASIEVAPDKILDTYEKGSKIPLVVLKPRYIYGKSSISVMAKAFKPSLQPNRVYHCSGKCSAEDVQLLKKMYADVQNSLHVLPNNSAVDFFQKLLYPFSKPVPFSMQESKIVSKLREIPMQFDSIKSLDEGYYILPNELDRSSKTFYYVPSSDIAVLKAFSAKYDVVEEKFVTIMERFLNEYAIYNSSLYALIEAYPTAEAVKKDSLLFKYYSRNKASAAAPLQSAAADG